MFKGFQKSYSKSLSDSLLFCHFTVASMLFAHVCTVRKHTNYSMYCTRVHVHHYEALHVHVTVIHTSRLLIRNYRKLSNHNPAILALMARDMCACHTAMRLYNAQQGRHTVTSRFCAQLAADIVLYCSYLLRRFMTVPRTSCFCRFWLWLYSTCLRPKRTN